MWTPSCGGRKCLYDPTLARQVLCIIAFQQGTPCDGMNSFLPLQKAKQLGAGKEHDIDLIESQMQLLSVT